MTPTVSVLIPVHNRRALLEHALASVFAQTHAADEILVVDDGSTDGSGELAASFGHPVRVLAIPHSGRSAARNAGIRACTGEWVALLDSDDIWEPNKLERQLAIVADRPDVGMVVGHVHVVDAAGALNTNMTSRLQKVQERCVCHGCSPEAVIRGSGIYTSTVMLRRTVLVELGTFNENLSGTEDWDLWLRVAAKSAIGGTPWPPVARYRLYPGNTDSQQMALSTLRQAESHVEEGTLSGRARAMLLVHAARAQATLGHRVTARRTLSAAFRLDPYGAATVGGLRLLVMLRVPPRARALMQRA